MATGSAPMVPMIATTAANTGKKLHGFDFFRAIGSPTRIAAPMVDQSELPFRMLCRAYGAQLCFTPMLHARMAVESKTYLPAHFTTCPGDRPLIAQFCGNDPATLLAAARLVQGSVDAVDLNLGCPQNIARRGRYGSFLLEETALVSRLVATLAEGLDVPVTAKIRLLPTFDATLRLVLALQAAGASMVTVHGRTREQNKERVGAADWATIRALKAHPDVAIPVIANGGIACSADVDACLAATAADGAMSSEALLEDPGLFSRRRRRRRQQPVRGAGGADGVGADAPAPHVAGGAGSPAVAADSFSSDSAPDSAPDSVADSFDLALEYLDLAEALPGADGGCVRAHLMRILFGVWERLPALRQEVVEVRVGGAQALALAAFRDVVLRARAAHREAGPVAAGLPPAAAAPAAACGGAAGAGSLPPRVATAPRAACAGAGGEAGAGGAAVEPAADADAGAAVASGGGGGGGGELGPTTPTAAADAVALSAADSRTARVAAWLAARTADPAVGWAHPAYADDAAAPGRWYMRYRSPRIAAAAGYEGPPKAPRPTQVAATATAAATRVAVAVIPSTSSCAALAASGTADTAGASHVPDGEPALKRARAE